MTDRESLIRAIVADPDNPVPRLVFADYLDEAGDHDWAELIRLQNGYFKHWTNLEEMREREAELVEAVTAKYPDVPGMKLEPPVRGFPERVLFFDAEVGPGWEDVLANYPITHFYFSSAFPRAVVAAGYLRCAISIDVSRPYPYLNDGDRDLLFGGLDPTRLRCLVCSGVPIGDDGAETLAAYSTLAGLTELDLSSDEIGPGGCDALIRSPYLRNIEYLDLSGNPVGDARRLERRFGPALRLA